MQTTHLTQKAFRQLYQKGVLKIADVFSNQQIETLKQIKENCYQKFPNGQNLGEDGPYKRTETTINQYNDISIWEPFNEDQRLCDILCHPLILDTVQSLLGTDFYLTACRIRKIPPGSPPLPVHKDASGSLALTILLDDIGVNEGATCLFPETHLNYPPPEYVLRDQNKFEGDTVQAIGDFGDVYFWLTDVWHGRVINSSNKTTCLLLVTFSIRSLSIKNTLRTHLTKDDLSQMPEKFQQLVLINQGDFYGIDKWLNHFFLKVGNAQNLFTKCLYNYFFYQSPLFLKHRINEKRYINTLILPEWQIQESFSLLEYFSKINIYITMRRFGSWTIRSIYKRSLSLKQFCSWVVRRLYQKS
jgi:putative 2OG-Fe(II) oxygenase